MCGLTSDGSFIRSRAGETLAFLREMATELHCDYVVHEVSACMMRNEISVNRVQPVKDNPFVILTRRGLDPQLPSVCLYSHMDVVPVFEVCILCRHLLDHPLQQYWRHPPFSAHKEANGDIYARGSQDMKCVGIQCVPRGALRCI